MNTYSILCRMDKATSAISIANDEYYKLEGELKEFFKKYVNKEFIQSLNAKQLLKVSAMASKYRPFEPFRFLNILSQANDINQTK